MKMKSKNWCGGMPISDIGVAHVNFVQYDKDTDNYDLLKVDTITFTKKQWEKFKREINSWFDTNGT